MSKKKAAALVAALAAAAAATHDSGSVTEVRAVKGGVETVERWCAHPDAGTHLRGPVTWGSP